MLCYDWDGSPLPIFSARPELAMTSSSGERGQHKMPPSDSFDFGSFGSQWNLFERHDENGLHLGRLQHALGCGIVQGCNFEIERCVAFQPIDFRGAMCWNWWEELLVLHLIPDLCVFLPMFEILDSSDHTLLVPYCMRMSFAITNTSYFTYLCIYIYIIYTHRYIHINTYTYTHIYSIYTYVYMHTCIHIYICT